MGDSRKALVKRESFLSRIMCLPEAELAWFAGWVSGDGSIKNAGSKRPRIKFVITDRDPLDKFSAMFGNKVTGPINPSGLGKLHKFEWQVSGWKAGVLLQRIYPWLSDRYQKRADPYMKYDAHGGRKLNPAQVKEIKRALSQGSHGINKKLAREYGVSDGLIAAIKHGRAWTHVREEDTVPAMRVYLAGPLGDARNSGL